MDLPSPGAPVTQTSQPAPPLGLRPVVAGRRLDGVAPRRPHRRLLGRHPFQGAHRRRLDALEVELGPPLRQHTLDPLLLAHPCVSYLHGVPRLPARLRYLKVRLPQIPHPEGYNDAGEGDGDALVLGDQDCLQEPLPW